VKLDGFPRLIAAVAGRSVGRVERPGCEDLGRYLVELERPAGGWARLQELTARVREAVEKEERGGAEVRFLRAVYVPEDERCFLLFEAGSRAAVEAALARAGLSGRGPAATALCVGEAEPMEALGNGG
jgi:hypothetical protein